MSNMPVFKKILHGLQPVNSAVNGNFIFHQFYNAGSLDPREFAFFQGRPYAADFRTFFPIFPEIMYAWLKMVGGSRYTGRFENGFNTVLVQGKSIFKNDAYIRFHVPDLIQAQLPSFNGPGDLYINKPADYAAEEYGHHTPETYGDQSPELKRSMKKHKYWSKYTEENMELQPML